MKPAADARFPTEGDALRLLGLGRVPRCSSCPRYAALVGAARSDGAVHGELPGVPASCSYQLCSPMAGRYEAARRLAPARLRRVGLRAVRM